MSPAPSWAATIEANVIPIKQIATSVLRCAIDLSRKDRRSSDRPTRFAIQSRVT
jgi:hypothetical protein